MTKHCERQLHWRRVVDEHAASGLTQIAFATQLRIPLKGLYRWRTRFREEADAGAARLRLIAAASPIDPKIEV